MFTIIAQSACVDNRDTKTKLTEYAEGNILLSGYVQSEKKYWNRSDSQTNYGRCTLGVVSFYIFRVPQNEKREGSDQLSEYDANSSENKSGMKKHVFKLSCKTKNSIFCLLAIKQEADG